MEGESRAFDRFMVDVARPQMRGDELGRQLREQDPDLKVLYFTGFSDRPFKSRQSLQKYDAFSEKPVTVRGLLEAVSLLLFGHTNGPV